MPAQGSPRVLDGAGRHVHHADDELIRRWLRNQQSVKPRTRNAIVLWAKVSEAFCIGSTSAKDACLRHGANADLLVSQ